jgi:hypothetical protein
MPDLLTINGVTFDRRRTRLRGRFVIFHAGDRDGTSVAAVYPPEEWEPGPAGTVAVIYVRRILRPIFVDGTGRDLMYEIEGEESWAPLLDLAVAAGLQLPEVP